MIHAKVILDPLHLVIISPWKNEGLFTSSDVGMGLNTSTKEPLGWEQACWRF